MEETFAQFHERLLLKSSWRKRLSMGGLQPQQNVFGANFKQKKNGACLEYKLGVENGTCFHCSNKCQNYYIIKATKKKVCY